VQTGSSAHYRNSSWDDNLELSSLKIGWDVARAFVMSAALTVMPLDFLNCGNHNVKDPFSHFGSFSAFNSFDVTICANDRQGLVPTHTAKQQFYSCQLFAALASATAKIRASIIAQTGGGRGMYGGSTGSAS
jgi:hypothetical protein